MCICMILKGSVVFQNKLAASYGMFLVGSKCSFKEIKISVQWLLLGRKLLESPVGLLCFTVHSCF